MEPTVPAHAVTEVFEWAVGPCKPSKSQRETTKISQGSQLCTRARASVRVATARAKKKKGRRLLRSRGGRRSRARARKKNEEVGDTSPGAGRWGVYGNFSFGDRYARFAYFRDQTFIGRILSSRQQSSVLYSRADISVEELQPESRYTSEHRVRVQQIFVLKLNKWRIV